MLFEQAFYYLPEIMAGANYPAQDYEGGIVGAYTMALLQALNGRNINNPISRIKLEHPFRSIAPFFYGPTGKRRYLRADLHLNIGKIGTGSKRLAAYGWKHSNWLEAKYFRAFDSAGAAVASKSQAKNTASLLADLLRLTCLVPLEQVKGKSISGRYLLHVYTKEISDHIRERNIGGKRQIRPWVKAITEPGRNNLATFSISNETKSVLKEIGDPLKDVEIQLTSSNLVITPDFNIPSSANIMCILSRIVDFQITYDKYTWELRSDGTSFQSHTTSYEKISKFVAKNIGLKGKTEEQKPIDVWTAEPG